MFNTRKIAIIGTGSVGVSCAFALMNQNASDEILMIDINKDKALGEVLDLKHGSEFLQFNTKVSLGEYKDCKDADVVIITASAPPKPGQTRLDTLEASASICESIVNPIIKYGFNGFFIIVANPVDIISYQVWKLSQLPKNKVIGTGTSLDSARLKIFISEYFNNIDVKSIQGFCMGEHGDSQMIPWSKVTVGGESFLNLIKKDQTLSNVNLDEIKNKTIKAGWEIYKTKGTTCYGVALSVVGIINAIFHDEQKVMAVSTLLQGEYGENNIYAGVPVVIGKNGVERIIELELNEDEEKELKKSFNILKGYVDKLKY